MPFEEDDIKYVKTYSNDPVSFHWDIEDFGFGSTDFWYEDGKLKCDNETLSKEQIKMILCKFVDDAEFMD